MCTCGGTCFITLAMDDVNEKELEEYDPDEVSCIGDEIRLLAVVKLYETGRLSSGAAAKMAEMSGVLFLSKLKEF